MLRETKEGKIKLRNKKKIKQFQNKKKRKEGAEKTSIGGEEERVGGSSGSIMRGFSAIA